MVDALDSLGYAELEAYEWLFLRVKELAARAAGMIVDDEPLQQHRQHAERIGSHILPRQPRELPFQRDRLHASP